MSKEIDALNYLVGLAVVGNKEKHRGKIFESEEIIYKALAINRPMKPLSNGLYGFGKCECGHIVNKEQNYCSNCGQKLDWTK